jgi:sugar O-acyltransferase (sialic acid O-acetyltransferase NeuD family)
MKKNFLEEKNHNLNPLVIIGASGHAISIANVAKSAGFTIKYFVDKSKKGKELLGYSVIGDLAELQHIDKFNFAIGVGDNPSRERIFKELKAEFDSMYFPPLIHQSAVVSFFAEVGDGTVVMPNAVIGPNSKIGMFCLINTQSSLDHDCVMSDFSSLAPAAITGGGVMLGFRSAVCIGAKIKHGIRIGDDSIVGANSYLNKDLANNQVAYGTPAREIRDRNIFDAYL